MADCWTAEVKETLTCLERLSLLQSKSYLQRKRKKIKYPNMDSGSTNWLTDMWLKGDRSVIFFAFII